MERTMKKSKALQAEVNKKENAAEAYNKAFMPKFNQKAVLFLKISTSKKQMAMKRVCTYTI